jgi:hypothetical protein
MPKRGRANKALKLTRWLGRRAAAYRQCQRDTLLKQVLSCRINQTG